MEGKDFTDCYFEHISLQVVKEERCSCYTEIRNIYFYIIFDL